MQESINKDLEELKNKHTETTQLLKLKNTPWGINSRISEAGERISELEDKMVEITPEEQNKVKRMKRIEDRLRDLWDNICIWIIGVPEEKERAWEHFWGDYSWKFSQHGKGISKLSSRGAKNPI